jgi:hypothetical protein
MNMNTTVRALTATVLVGAISASALAQSGNNTIRRNTVIPIIFEQEIHLRNNRVGDTFVVRVDESRDLPRNSRIEGRIVRLDRGNKDRAGFVDVEFNNLLLPDGRRTRVQATPVPLNARFIQRDRDGRLTASKHDDRDKYVLSSTVGGLILGSLVKKPFEGAVIGALAGVVLAETNKRDTDVAVRRGAKMGALFQRDVSFTYNGPWDARHDDRYDPRYDDRYDPRRDDRYDPRRDDRYDPRNDDRYNGGYNGRGIVVELDRRELSFSRNEEPYRQGNVVMVPVERMARHLGLSSESMANGRVVFVEDRNNSLRLENGSREYRLNGRRGNLSQAIATRNGVLFAPVEVFADMTERPVYVNGARVRN